MNYLMIIVFFEARHQNVSLLIMKPKEHTDVVRVCVIVI